MEALVEVSQRCVVGHLDCQIGGEKSRRERWRSGGEDWTQKLRTQKTTTKEVTSAVLGNQGEVGWCGKKGRANNTDWKAVESRRDNRTVVEWVNVEALRRPHSDHWRCATRTQGILGNVLENEQKERWVGIPYSPRTQHTFSYRLADTGG